MTYTLTITTANIKNGKTVTTTEKHQSNSLSTLRQMARGKWWADTLITATNDIGCVYEQTKGY